MIIELNIKKIKGLGGVRKDMERTLDLLKLKKKYSCVLVEEKREILGMLEKVKSFISYGEIDEDTRKELILKRGRLLGDKPVKNVNENNMKPFFRLHPPIGGFRKSTKKIFPQGILGENNKINELIRSML